MLPVMFAIDVPAGPLSASPLTIRLRSKTPWACTSGTAASSIVTHTGQPWNRAADKFSFDWIIESSPPETICVARGFSCPGKLAGCVLFRTFAGLRHRPLPNIRDMDRGNLRRHNCAVVYSDSHEPCPRLGLARRSEERRGGKEGRSR